MHRHETLWAHSRTKKTQRRLWASGLGERAPDSTAGQVGKGVSWCCAVKPGSRDVHCQRREGMRDVRELEQPRRHHQRNRIIT